MGTSGIVAKYTSLLDVNADMVFFLFDEPIHSFNKHTFRLNASLKYFLYISCIKWATFG